MRQQSQTRKECHSIKSLNLPRRKLASGTKPQQEATMGTMHNHSRFTVA